SIRDDDLARRDIENGLESVDLAPGRMDLVAQPQIERQVRGNLVVVGDEEVKTESSAVDEGLRKRAGAGGGNARQKIVIRMVGEAVGKSHGAEQVGRGLAVLKLNAADQESGLETMASAEPAQLLLKLL